MPKVTITVSEKQKRFLELYKKEFKTPYAELLRQLLTKYIIGFGEPEKVMIPAAYSTTHVTTTVIREEKREYPVQVVMPKDLKTEFQTKVAKKIMKKEKAEGWGPENMLTPEEIRNITN